MCALREIEDRLESRIGKPIQLARTLGVSPQAVTEWFKGRKEPTGEQVLAMQEILSRRRKLSK
jgi:DNA-binding transcriptional regulator YiaG